MRLINRHARKFSNLRYSDKYLGHKIAMDMRNFSNYFIFIAVLMVSAMSAANDMVRYNISKLHPDPKQSYYIDLLTLILDASRDKFGDYQLIPVTLEMSQGRTSIMVRQGKAIDVTWRMTSKSLEQELQAVYIPVLKGLMGARIAIIRREDNAIFSPNLTLEELKALSAGQGYDWPDSDILRHNGFDVIEGSAFSMLTMLDKHRFDYFPRALHEPWLEIANNGKFIVEGHFLLKYPAPMYFFTSKKNTRLAKRIQYGFDSIIDSGAFDEFFYHHSVTRDILVKANLPQRKVFSLENPLLSEKSREILNKKSLWLAYFH